MKEKTLQKIFEEYLIKNKICYEKEFLCHSGLMDFKIEIGGKTCGVEVKSLMGSIQTTIGQLVLAQKTFSNVYLLAPEEFIQEMENVVLETGVLANIGLIVFKEGGFIFLKEPLPKSYYFNPIQKKRRRFLTPQSKTMSVGDLDLGIISTFENRVFDYNLLVSEIKISRSNANQRLKRLIKMGLVEEISSDNPKRYRVKKVVDWGTKIPVE
jgi:DNA-binding transcriptional ArsR family regulator